MQSETRISRLYRAARFHRLADGARRSTVRLPLAATNSARTVIGLYR